MSSSIFASLYKTIVRSHLDYVSSVWSPYLRKHIEMVGVQRRATKQLPGLSNLSYPYRWRNLELPTLAYRRIRGDMIDVYEITSETYNDTVKKILTPMTENVHSTSGNSKRLYHPPVKTERWKHSFSIRVTIPWNTQKKWFLILHTSNNTMEHPEEVVSHSPYE